jgi:hypothetical protein
VTRNISPAPSQSLRGDDRRVHIEEVALLEELMDRECQPAAQAEDGAEEIRARSQMRDGAQEFQRVALLLQRIGRVRRPDQLEARGSAQLPFLALRWRDDTSFPSTTADAPVVSWARCSEPGVPASTTTCRFARHEPSLSSRNENPFESRRVRTQPLTVTASFGSVAARMCLTSVRM